MSASRFEDEPRWVEYFWEAYIASHRYEEDLTNCITWKVTRRDVMRYPELSKVKHVTVYEDDAGHVHGVLDKLSAPLV